MQFATPAANILQTLPKYTGKATRVRQFLGGIRDEKKATLGVMRIAAKWYARGTKRKREDAK
jgi:hypothetical protein